MGPGKRISVAQGVCRCAERFGDKSHSLQWFHGFYRCRHLLVPLEKMLGPVDERRVSLRTGFNMYATHSFGFMEMLQLAEVIGAECIIGMSKDETAEDVRDFVEYVNGAASTVWGARRVSDGHAKPYNLKYIQVDNERNMTLGYVKDVEKFAEAAWSVDPDMSIMLSVNIPRSGYPKGSKEYRLVSDLADWFIKRDKVTSFAGIPIIAARVNLPMIKEDLRMRWGLPFSVILRKTFPVFT